MFLKSWIILGLTALLLATGVNVFGGWVGDQSLGGLV